MPKGKGKGKKGSKSGKKAKKDLSIKSMSEANSKLWETRLDIVEKSRQEYRENARHLLLENDSLQNQVQQTEKDTIDVVTYLKRQDQDKDSQLEQMMTQIKDMKRDHRKEKEQIIDDFSQQVSDLETRLAQKNHEVEVMQAELKVVKEFRKKRGLMQKELDEIKEAMFDANREHKDTLTRMEQKFFEEKMRLQQEANQKIAELADRAHSEAIQNLDETTKSVYKENVRVSEALSYHTAEGDKLKAATEKLEAENTRLTADNEMNALVIQEKVAQTRKQKHTINELEAKVSTLEQSLSHMVREFETERGTLTEHSRLENDQSRAEISKLSRTLDLKTKEMNKVKRLARRILDQRTEIERFFLEALEQVKQEITLTRMQYRRDAHQAYQQKMLTAHVGKGDYPKIRTFSKSDHSTNSVFQDLEAAEAMFQMSGKVDIGDLTWEQKEKVLRFLFARMNGQDRAGRGAQSAANAQSQSMPSLTQKPAWEEPVEDNTFLTQAAIDDSGRLSPNKLPQIHSVSAPQVAQAEQVS